jgi:hypothetical protein
MAKRMEASDTQAPEAGIRTDLEAHDHAMGLPIARIVEELAGLLGATTVAVIGNVQETRAVQQWIDGREPQRAHTLRFALQIATMLAKRSDREVARAWFHGSNPRLNDQAPMFLLRDEPLHEIQAPILSAAREFAKRI